MARNNQTPFYKMTGGGNDFVLFDNRKNVLPKDFSALAKKLCERKFSIGADGLLILEEGKDVDFRMIYYNADGSRAEMCGNGARCIARFANLLKIAPQKVHFQTDSGPLSAEISEQSVKLKMTPPTHLRLDSALKLDNQKECQLSSIHTGVPHAVVLTNDIQKTDVLRLGQSIRAHREFAPQGTNVNFVQVKDSHNLIIRTYERGVETETLACGTGATASALICGLKNMTLSPVSCLTRGGEILKIYFQIEKGESGPDLKEVYLEGPATVCYQGQVEI